MIGMLLLLEGLFWRMYEVAKENGYLLDVPEFISEKDVGFLPDDKVVIICTGSQGEPRAR